MWVEQTLADPDSVFYYYQELIRLRKQHPIMVYGDYELLLPEHEYIYAYTRTLEGEKWLILLNFSVVPQTVDLTEELNAVTETIIGNYHEEPAAMDRSTLRPYEARVCRIG